MPRRRRHDRREAPSHRHARAFGDEGDRGEMALDHFAEIDVDEIAVLVDHGVDRVDIAQHPHDLELLLVQRIAGEIALDRRRVFHEARAVKRPDRVRVRDSRRDDLPAARVARHEMRLDEPGRDAHFRLDEAPVELDRRAPHRRHAEIDMGRVVARKVILDAHRVEHPRIADDFGELRALVRPMEARRDQHGDAFARHAAGEQALDQRPQEQVVGNRPRDVADEDARAPLAAHQRLVRGCADRPRQRIAHRGPRIRQLHHRPLADHRRARVPRQPDVHFRLAVENADRRYVHAFVHRFLASSQRANARRDQFTPPRPGVGRTPTALVNRRMHRPGAAGGRIRK